MTLRDYFAAKAINLFSLDRTEIAQLQSGEWEPLHNLAAKFCYQLADAMLRARKEQP